MRRRVSSLCALACLFAGLFPAPAAGQVEALVYRVQHRRAEEMLPMARTLLAGQGNAEVDRNTNSLVLLGEAEALERARAILVEQDRPPKTVILHYESRTLAELSEKGVRVDWSVAGESFRVGNARPPPGAPGSYLAFRAEGVEARRSERFAGTLRVLEGHAGRIETGTAVPILVRHRRGVSSTVISAASGFEARPRVLGDGRVEIALDPFDDRLETGDGSLAVSRTGASTTVIVPPGEAVIVGGISRGAGGTTSGAGGRASGGSASERVLLISVEVE